MLLKQQSFGGAAASLIAATATTVQSACIFKWHPQFVLLLAVMLPALSSSRVSTTIVLEELLRRTHGRAGQGISQTGK